MAWSVRSSRHRDGHRLPLPSCSIGGASALTRTGCMLYRLLAFWDRYRAMTTGVAILTVLGLGVYLLEHLGTR